jgi:large subunit ribosomal protein L10
MDKSQKEKVVADLVERLRATDSLIVADYRGLTNAQLVDLRAKLRGSGARLTVVKNTLTRRAAEEAGTDAILALLEGPTAIAFVEAEGDPVAVAKALADAAKDTKVLALRGGLLSGQTLTGADVEELAKLPAPEVVKAQLVGVMVAPLTQLAALIAAPVRDLVGLIDARIAQLEEGGDTSAAAVPAVEEAPAEADDDEPAAEAEPEQVEPEQAEPEPEQAEPEQAEPEASAPADEAVAEATEDTPEASDEAAPAEPENADTGTEEE